MSILKVNTIQDKGGNTLLSSDGSGVISSGGAITSTPFFQAKVTNQSQGFSQNTYTAVLFDTKDFDTNNAYDTATGKFQPSEAGYYYIFGQIAFATSGGNEQIHIWKNGSEYLMWSQTDAGVTANNHKAQQVQKITYLNGSTDYVQIRGLNSGSGTSYLSPALLQAGGGEASVFFAYKLIGA